MLGIRSWLETDFRAGLAGLQFLLLEAKWTLAVPGSRQLYGHHGPEHRARRDLRHSSRGQVFRPGEYEGRSFWAAIKEGLCAGARDGMGVVWHGVGRHDAQDRLCPSP